MANEELKDRLLAARTRSGLSQEEVARRAGITQPTYSGLETGQHKGSTHLIKICQIIGADPNYILTGDSKMGTESMAAAIASLPDEDREIVERLILSLLVRSKSQV